MAHPSWISISQVLTLHVGTMLHVADILNYWPAWVLGFCCYTCLVRNATASSELYVQLELASRRDGFLTATRLRKEVLSISVGCLSAQRGEGPKTPVSMGKGAQGPWRRGAFRRCRLSQQLLACCGRPAREDRPAHLLRPCHLRLRFFGVIVEGPFKGSVPASRPTRVAMLRLTVRIHVARDVQRIFSARELRTCLLTVFHELFGVIN